MIQDTVQQFISSLDAVDIFMRIVGSIMGIIYLSYGKKQNFWYALCGLGLLVYPYFFHTKTEVIAVGVGLLFAPMFLTRLIR
ncbi:MAG: hypothetical protein K0R12_486 [Gammaproteobacteria bacterium]|jgi:nicotinamide riboside transporter PnuC|nr:hypothetical protein [Gammaproteobacteria bacterium]